MIQHKLIDLATFRSEARAGKRPDAGVFRISAGTPVEAGARSFRFCFSDGSIDRAGDTIDPEGWDTDSFLKNPVALWAHNSWEPPVGRAGNVAVEGQRLMGDIEFAPAEVYPFADTIYRLIAAKYIQACSVGFMPLEWSFVEDKSRGFGIDFKRQELLEISVVPVPCNANALTEARAKGIDIAPLRAWAERLLDSGGSIVVPRKLLEATFKAAKTPAAIRKRYLAKAEADWQVGASRDLPIDESEDWDGDAAAASIFAHAGGDDFDPAVARKGFLLYDANKLKERGSYKEPFARVEGGTLKAIKGGIKAAASRLPQTDVPQAAKDEARKVIDHYEENMSKQNSGARRRDGMSETDPASGGTLVANCGRKPEEECGLKDPEECVVHSTGGTGDGDDKSLLAQFVAQLAGEMRGLLARRRNGANGDSEPDGDEAQQDAMREALVHIKAAGALHDLADQHRDKCMDRLAKAVDALANPEAEGGKAMDSVAGHVRAAHGHLKDAEGYAEAAMDHHDKAENAMEEAVDTIANPEAEGGKAAALRRAEERAEKHRKDPET